MTTRSGKARSAVLAGVSLFILLPALALPAEYLAGTQIQQQRAYSPGVITEGGRIVWLAGQTAVQDLNGKGIVGDFDAQVRTVFQLMDRTLKRAGGTLADLVTMTVFINDARHGERFVAIRAEFFPDGNFPASALLTISNFALPGMLVEVQGVAVIGEQQ